jgi:hypothetical protein
MKEAIQKALKELDVLIKENTNRIEAYIADGGEEHNYLDGKATAYIEVRELLIQIKKAL